MVNGIHVTMQVDGKALVETNDTRFHSAGRIGLFDQRAHLLLRNIRLIGL